MSCKIHGLVHVHFIIMDIYARFVIFNILTTKIVYYNRQNNVIIIKASIN